MTDIEIFFCAALFALFVVYSFQNRLRQQTNGLPHLQKIMQGNASRKQLREFADSLAKSVIEQAETLKKPPLFITASGDLYDDFFPARETRGNWTAEQFANVVLADGIKRYREVRNRNVDIVDFHAFTLCFGAGLAVSSFRRLADCLSDMRDIAEFLAPAPDPNDWETYQKYYREAGALLNMPPAQVDSFLMKRRERFREN